MSFFTMPSAVVDLDGGTNTITIRALTYGEEQDIKARAMRVAADASGQGQVTIDAILMQRLTMHTCITAWQGPGFDGRPVTPAAIDELPPWVLARVTAAYNDLTVLTPMEKKA